jgi:hypothetical protein
LTISKIPFPSQLPTTEAAAAEATKEALIVTSSFANTMMKNPSTIRVLFPILLLYHSSISIGILSLSSSSLSMFVVDAFQMDWYVIRRRDHHYSYRHHHYHHRHHHPINVKLGISRSRSSSNSNSNKHHQLTTPPILPTTTTILTTKKDEKSWLSIKYRPMVGIALALSMVLLVQQLLQQPVNRQPTSTLLLHLLQLMKGIVFQSKAFVLSILKTIHSSLPQQQQWMIKGMIPVLGLVHGVCAMIFGGSIITTTILEWRIMLLNNHDSKTNDKNHDDINSTINHQQRSSTNARLVIDYLFPLEKIMVIPSLVGTILSGTVLTWNTYGIQFFTRFFKSSSCSSSSSIIVAAPHIKASIYVLGLFTLWWLLTDVPNQRLVGSSTTALSTTTTPPTSTSESSLNHNQDNNTNINSSSSGSNTSITIWKRRRIGNIISCVFVVVLYTLMILKPTFS